MSLASFVSWRDSLPGQVHHHPPPALEVGCLVKVLHSGLQLYGVVKEVKSDTHSRVAAVEMVCALPIWFTDECVVWALCMYVRVCVHLCACVRVCAHRLVCACMHTCVVRCVLFVFGRKKIITA